jgi:predicted ATPase/DNA-binding winged helix-turn-helix (wHTH) protein
VGKGAPPAPASALSFGPFRLLPAQRTLLEADKPVRLGGRALEILTVLVERPGELVSKADLVARVWPDTFVEEGSLRVHVAALRRALGDGQAGNRYIANVPGRGYRFVAPVQVAEGPTAPARPAPVSAPASNLPAPITRMIGRVDTVRSLVSQLPQRRFISIVGPGGMGKTTLALAVADALTSSYEDGVRFVDLAPVGHPQLVPAALAAVLGVAIRSDDPIPGVIAFLADKEMLVVLDNCEHVIEAAASLAEELLRGAAGVHLLATSREPLRAEGERVHRLSALAMPVSSRGLTAVEALAFPAVQLFVERAAANLDDFELSDADAPIVAEICHQLDGIALAIELAAGRVHAFGIAGLAELLQDRFPLLLTGRRTALPRHQTLSAALDWSYGLLPEPERVVLRRLAVFRGGTTLESASAVAADDDIVSSEIVGCIANLVAKSLVTADVGGPLAHYRLLETTRAYARERLIESGELERFTRRHAEHYRDLFEQAEAEWSTRPTDDWIAAYLPCLDNVRVALDWAFGDGGDAAVGVVLTVAAEPLWGHLSLIDECRRRVEQALASLDSGAMRGTRRHVQLLAAIGSARLYSSRRAGSDPAEIEAAFAGALELAEALGDTDYQLKALWGLWVDRFNRGEHRHALELATRFRDRAARASEPADRLVGERMIGFSLQLLGEQLAARQHTQRMLDRYVAPIRRSHLIRFHFDQRITAQMTLSQILWQLGFPDQAMATLQAGVEDALRLGHAMSLCNILAQAACPVALYTGHLAQAERFVSMLLDHSARHSLQVWHIWGRCFGAALAISRGDQLRGLEAFRAAFNELPRTRFALRHTAFLGELAEAQSHAGETARSVATIRQALERSERNEELWCKAELLRIKGEILLRAATADAQGEAEQAFLQALDWARRQSALSWELRAATSLARLRARQGRADEGRTLLAATYQRFTEGFETADLMAAADLLRELRPAREG